MNIDTDAVERYFQLLQWGAYASLINTVILTWMIVSKRLSRNKEVTEKQ